MAEEAQTVATISSGEGGTDECFVPDSQRGVSVQSLGTPLEVNPEIQNEGKAPNENENNRNSNRSDDEIKYPGRFTKVAVGLSLSLAIFLV